jgi:protein SCO1/2
MKFYACLAAPLFLFIVPSACAQTYSAFGMVLRTDPAHLLLEVSCQTIPGYQDATVMTLPVHDSNALTALQPGMLIDFKVNLEHDKPYAEEIRVHKYENIAQEPMASRQLEILDAATGPGHPNSTLQLGQLVPDFTLVNQKRENVTLSTFRGKIVALTFIYTSCPLPNFCFRMSNNFGVLHQHFAKRMGKDLVLLSITFDPEHDQPETLAEYARTWTKDSTGWHFLTGPSADVRKICQEFGVTAWQDEGLMTHSLHTVIIDQQGRVAANLEGNEYTAKQLTDLVALFIDNGH